MHACMYSIIPSSFLPQMFLHWQIAKSISYLRYLQLVLGVGLSKLTYYSFQQFFFVFL